MSQATRPRLIIEWSPGHVRAFQPSTGAVKEGKTISAAVSGLPTADALIALSRRASFVRTLRVPNASREDVQLILRNQLTNILPVSGSELAYDFQLTDDFNAEGRLALVAAIQADQLRELLEECRQADVAVRAIAPASLGAPALMRHKALVDCAVVEATDGGISIDLVQGGILRYSRWSPSENDYTAEVARTLAAAGILALPTLAAGGAIFPADHSTSESTLKALSEFDLAHPVLNIELAEVRAARELSSRQNGMRVAGLVLAAGIIAAGIVGYRRISTQNQIAAVTSQEDAKLANLKETKTTAQKADATSTAQVMTIHRGFDQAQKIWEIVSAVTDSTPTGMWLNGLNVERGKEILIRGTAVTAQTVPEFTQRLAASGRFRDVHLLYSNDAEIDQKPVTEFSISAFPIGNLPLIDAPNSGAPVPAPASSGGNS